MHGPVRVYNGKTETKYMGHENRVMLYYAPANDTLF